MKTKFFTPSTLTLLFGLLLLLSCGKDGKDGSAYISFDWDWYVDSFSDTNPKTPSTLLRGKDYSTSPGTYNFDYQCSDGAGSFWEYSGTYRISINKGEDGKLFKKGDDGKDKYHNYALTGTGYSHSVHDKNNSIPKLEKESLSESTTFIPQSAKTPVGEPETEIYYSGNAKIVVTKQCFKIDPPK